MKIILLACIERNIGDDLFIETVCKRYPDVQFIISSSANYGSIKRISNLKFSNVLKLFLRFSNVNTESRIKAFVAKLFCKVLKLFFLDVVAAIYIVGNAFKNMNYLGSWQIDWLRYRLILSNHFFMISTNFGPFNDEHWRTDAFSVFSKINDICFRDEQSFDYFKDLPNVRFCPDAIFSLGRKKHHDDMVLFSIIDTKMASRAEIFDDFASSQYESLISQLIDYYISIGKKVCLILSNERQDYNASKRILSSCSSKDVNVYHYQGNTEEVRNLFEESDLIFSTRLHTTILGFLYGLRVIPFVYNIKIENVLKSINFNGVQFKISDLNPSINMKNIIKAADEYNFVLDEEVVCDSSKQFAVLDDFISEKKRRHHG